MAFAIAAIATSCLPSFAISGGHSISFPGEVDVVDNYVITEFMSTYGVSTILGGIPIAGWFLMRNPILGNLMKSP